jgi:hypothetical protein
MTAATDTTAIAFIIVVIFSCKKEEVEKKMYN